MNELFAEFKLYHVIEGVILKMFIRVTVFLFSFVFARLGYILETNEKVTETANAKKKQNYNIKLRKKETKIAYISRILPGHISNKYAQLFRQCRKYFILTNKVKTK